MTGRFLVGERPSVLPIPDPAWVPWVAGIIEGEGSIMALAMSGGVYPRVSVQMTDRDVLDRLQVSTTMGHVSGPALRGESKPIWTWQVTRQFDVEALLEAIRPWMGVRRTSKIDEVLGVWRARSAA